MSSASVGCGSRLRTKSLAAARSSPFGAPDASRPIAPPAGSGMWRVMPASRSATLLTTSVLKKRIRITGCWSVAGSRSQRVGRRPGGAAAVKLPSFQPSPTIQCPGGVITARARTSSIISSGERHSSSRMRVSLTPTCSRWLWLSKMPGNTVRPPRSYTRVAAFASGSTSASAPRIRTRPALMAIACAVGWRSASV
jgi:hypothetical protein